MGRWCPQSSLLPLLHQGIIWFRALEACISLHSYSNPDTIKCQVGLRSFEGCSRGGEIMNEKRQILWFLLFSQLLSHLGMLFGPFSGGCSDACRQCLFQLDGCKNSSWWSCWCSWNLCVSFLLPSSCLQAGRYCVAVVRRKGFIICLMLFTLLPFPRFSLEEDESLNLMPSTADFKSVEWMSKVSLMLTV